jgi:hypothetical protein
MDVLRTYLEGGVVICFRVLFRYLFEAVDEILQFLFNTPNSCECFEICADSLTEYVILMLYQPAWQLLVRNVTKFFLIKTVGYVKLHVDK